MPSLVQPHVLPALDWRPTNAKSGRSGDQVRLVVMHRWGVRYTDEPAEAASYQGVIRWFSDPHNDASAHVVYPGSAAPGQAAQMVAWADAAWTESHYNSCSVEVESADAVWLGHDPNGLAQLARIAAWLLHHFGLPARWSTSRGLCRHADLGIAGGGHTSCPTTDMALWHRFVALVEDETRRGGFRPSWGRQMPGRYDDGARRQAKRSGGERGVWVYLPAEELAAAGVDPNGPEPFYRTWGRGRRSMLLRLYVSRQPVTVHDFAGPLEPRMAGPDLLAIVGERQAVELLRPLQPDGVWIYLLDGDLELLSICARCGCCWFGDPRDDLEQAVACKACAEKRAEGYGVWFRQLADERRLADELRPIVPAYKLRPVAPAVAVRHAPTVDQLKLGDQLQLFGQQLRRRLELAAPPVATAGDSSAANP